MSELRKVRTTMQPNDEIEVDEAEYSELSRQGLLVNDDSTTLAEQTRETEIEHGHRPKTAAKEGN